MNNKKNYGTQIISDFLHIIKDFPKERYTTPYLYVKSFFNHKA